MVLRLFVPPGEGQHRLVPKRPDTIGANATLQSCLVSSTLLAAVYTSFASTFNQRVAPQQAILPCTTTKPALFVRSSARLGLCVGLAGAAVNWYYYSSFANVVVAEKVQEVKKWRLYEWSTRYTVDDGALAGAALGFSASLPMLLRRRLPGTLSRWTRCLGMTNIGACTGVLGAHAYFQYTGERQKAYKRLDAHRKRRSLEFWAIFWDKELMAKLSPIMQQYVRHNGVWYTQLLPDDAFERMDDDNDDEVDEAAVQTTKQTSDVDTHPAEQKPDLPFYFEPVDYTVDLKQINVESTKLRIEEMEVEKEVLLEEAEYLLFINAQQRYEYCHKNDTMDPDERLRRLQEIHLVDVAYNRLRNAADALDMKILHWRMSLQHKAAWESCPPDNQTNPTAAWLPQPHLINPSTHRPSFSALEIEKLQAQIYAEVLRFQQGSADERYAREKRERWRKDAEDGRVILRAADHVLFRMQKPSEGKCEDGEEKRGQSGRGKVTTTTTAAAAAAAAAVAVGVGEGSGAAASTSPGNEIHPMNESKPTNDDDDNGTDPTMDEMRLRKQVEQSRADAQKAAKPRRESLEPNKP